MSVEIELVHFSDHTCFHDFMNNILCDMTNFHIFVSMLNFKTKVVASVGKANLLIKLFLTVSDIPLKASFIYHVQVGTS